MIKLEVFTDPMMGLSYEMEPIMRFLETHYQGQIEVIYRMGWLVRDVRDWFLPSDFLEGEEKIFYRYNRRLANIYLSEEKIAGMPICVDGLNLFSEELRSSLPLNLAYKTVEQLAPERAAAFLYFLRYATIVNGRQTTNLAVLSELVEEFGLNQTDFLEAYHGRLVQEELAKDLRDLETLGVRGLPAYRLSDGETSFVFQGVLTLAEMIACLGRLSTSTLVPNQPVRTLDHFQILLTQRELISLIEVQLVYGFKQEEDVMEFLAPLLKDGSLDCHQVKEVYFFSLNRKRKSLY